jgi:hypothetical protein
MEFGFGFLVLFFVIFFGVGRMCGWGRRCRREDKSELGPSGKEYERRLSDLESRVKGRLQDRAARDRLVQPMAHRPGKLQETERPRLAPRRKSKLEELQKKFVDGQLTLSEYEQELDRLERLE